MPAVRQDIVQQVVSAIAGDAEDKGYEVEQAEFAEYVAIFSQREGLSLSEVEIAKACDMLMDIVFE